MVTVGLFLLGLGWSAATVAGSALLAESLPADEKTNVQSLSDSSMNLAGALGGGLAGSVLATSAFIGVNVAALVPVVIIVGLGAFGRLERQ